MAPTNFTALICFIRSLTVQPHRVVDPVLTAADRLLQSLVSPCRPLPLKPPVSVRFPCHSHTCETKRAHEQHQAAWYSRQGQMWPFNPVWKPAGEKMKQRRLRRTYRQELKDTEDWVAGERFRWEEEHWSWGKEKQSVKSKETSVMSVQTFHTYIYSWLTCLYIITCIPPLLMYRWSGLFYGLWLLPLQTVCWHIVSCGNTLEEQKKKYCRI